MSRLSPFLRSLAVLLGLLSLLPPPLARAALPAAVAIGRSLPYGTRAQPHLSLGGLPLAFEPNVGQADPRVRFLAHGPGYTLYLSATGLELVRRPALPARGQARSAPLVERLPLSGLGAPLRLQGEQRLTGVVNYLVGHDPHGWHTGISTYGRVVYDGVAPGLDLALSGAAGALHITPVLQEGVPNASGAWAALARRLTALGWRGAVLPGYRPAVATGEAGVTVPPPLSYATYLGGSGDEVGAGIALDNQGHAYVTGRADSTGFPVTPGAFQPKYGGYFQDAFVAELAPAGDRLLYATYLGGGGNDWGNSIAVDRQGDAYITGSTTSPDFPVTLGAFQAFFGCEFNPKYGPSGGNAFVAELAPAGDRLLYATYLGHCGDDAGTGIAVDNQGHAYVTGSTGSTDFPVTPRAFQPKYGGGTSGGENAFVAKLTPAGDRLLYATYLGGSGDEAGTGIAVDNQGHAYVTGRADSTGFPVTPGAFQPKYGGGTSGGGDAFVAKLTPAGDRLLYATYLGGSGDEVGAGIALDNQGHAYVTGRTGSTDFPATPGAFKPKYGANTQNAFVAELTPAGDRLLYATYLGGSNDDAGAGIAVDNQGHAYVTGRAGSTDFPVTPGAFQPKYGGGTSSGGDAFVAKLAPAGDRLLYATYLGGSGDEVGAGIALDNQGHAYIAGRTGSTDFPAAPGAFQPKYGGGTSDGGDAYVARIVIPTQPLAALDPVRPPPLTAGDVRYFPATHHTLAGPFLAFWKAQGGLPLLGMPLSQSFVEGGQTVQYTERARLVLAQGSVHPSSLGRLLTAGRRFPPLAPAPDTATRLSFPSTHHALSGSFLAFWQAHQGGLLFGPPISEPLREANGDGSGRVYLVQYCANARLEFHPDLAGTAYVVTVGLLGREYLHLSGLL